MVSSTPDGSGFPIGLMPGALPSDHASRQTLKTTAVRLPLGHTQLAFVMSNRTPCRTAASSYQLTAGRAKARPSCRADAVRRRDLTTRPAWARLALPTLL